MPSPNPTTRRQYAGAAVATTLNGGITSGAGSFVVVSAAGWPNGAVGNFIVTIDRGLATEERIKCSAQSAGTVTVAASGRGFDSTTAQAHANGATVECTLSAFDADEWNQHTNATTGVHGVAGAVVGTTDVQSLTNKTLDAASTLGGVSGTSLAADRTAWTSFTPTMAVWTAGNGVFVAAYKQIGKSVNVRISFTLGGTTVTTTGTPTFSLPVTPVAGTGQNLTAVYFKSSATANHFAGAAQIPGAATVEMESSTGSITSTVPFTWGSGDNISVTGVYEAA